MENIDGYKVVELQSVVDALDTAISLIKTVPTFAAELRNMQTARDSFARANAPVPYRMH